MRTGYLEMIPRNTPLPAHASETLETAIDNVDRDIFQIASLASPLSIPRTIAEVELRGIQIAKKGIANVKIDLSIDNDQVGRVMVQDTKTLSTASVTFNAAKPNDQISSPDQEIHKFKDRNPT
jgi:molecular chaperone DnaK (HSP70)